MGNGTFRKRLDALEGHGGRFDSFGLPRDPDERRELLDRVRREQLRRITENPEAFRDKLARILRSCPPRSGRSSPRRSQKPVLGAQMTPKPTMVIAFGRERESIHTRELKPGDGPAMNYEPARARSERPKRIEGQLKTEEQTMKYYPEMKYYPAPVAEIEMDALDSETAFFSQVTRDHGIVLTGAAGGRIQPWYACAYDWLVVIEQGIRDPVRGLDSSAAAAKQFFDRVKMNRDPAIYFLQGDGEFGIAAVGMNDGSVRLWEACAGDVGSVEEVRSACAKLMQSSPTEATFLSSIADTSRPAP